MDKAAPLALCKCPECGHDKAEVKKAKNGTAYRFCPNCSAQYFTQKADKSRRLFASVGLNEQGEKINASTGRKADTETEVKQKLSGFEMGL